MGRTARWGTLAASDLVPRFGRDSTKVTAAIRAHAKGVPPASLYEAQNKKEFSLGADVLDTLGDTGYPHPSPVANKLVGPAWECWRQLGGNVDKMSKAWLSLLVRL